MANPEINDLSAEPGMTRRGMFIFIAVMAISLFAGGLIGFLRRRAATSSDTPTGPGTR